MSSLWFCVPAHGRLSLTRICLRQLRRTCDALIEEGIEATAVVVACDENLETARDLGFGTVERDNQFVSRRFNDGIQLACDPAYNPRPADYVIPCGSDDWIDHRIFLELPAADTVLGFRRLSFVREDGREMRTAYVDYAGGCGIRVYPRQIVERLGYRPADEDRGRACDTSILTNLQQDHDFNITYGVLDARQIVDWKSPEQQLNPYTSVGRWCRGKNVADPFEALADVFPAESLDEMAAHYGLVTA